MHGPVWDDPPSLLDQSELSSSVIDSSHASQLDEDDGEMELSSTLALSAASSLDSDDDRTPLFPKASAAPVEQAPQLSHLTERQQLAYLMRTTQHQQRRPSISAAATARQQQPKRSSSPATQPAQAPHSTKHRSQLSTAAIVAAALTAATKPSILTHDKKRRRTAAATPATAAAAAAPTAATSDADDSHLYTVQRLPQHTTAPIPLPTPPHYHTDWSNDQRRRWDRISSQPGHYYYRHKEPGAAARAGDWAAEELELLVHLLVCHPVGSGGSESDWGLFSMNVPGRVGAECERQWKALVAAGKLVREDRFDYMQWYERQRLRALDDANAAESDQPKQSGKVEASAEPVVAEAVASAADAHANNAATPVVINRKRVVAPPPPPATHKPHSELAAAAPTAALKAETAAAKPDAATAPEQPTPQASDDVTAESNGAIEKQPLAIKEERAQRRGREKDRQDVRDQPPRKKTPLELHMLRAQAAYEVRKARLQSLLQAELARVQPDLLLPADHSSIGRFRPNAARLSTQYYCQPTPAVDQSVAVEQHKLVRALHGRIGWMQADVEREYRLQCDMLTAVYAAECK